jgi:SAM-dependent methyltransferase
MRGSRLRARAKERLVRVGNRVQCPCCGGSFWCFLAYGARPHDRCPQCGALGRHRLLSLVLRDRLAGQSGLRFLHVAPEESIASLLRRVPDATYLSIDLEPGAAMEVADLTDLPFRDSSWDVVLCYHVLEHVPDDTAAMREIRRVLVPGGWAIIDSPIDTSRHETFEDPSITDPAERRRLFSQDDHVRVYGRNFVSRLRDAGFDVEVDYPLERYSPEKRARYGLPEAQWPLGDGLHFCRKA